MRAAAAAAVLVALGGCTSSPPAGPPVPQREITVELTCATGDEQAPCAFRPADVTIRAGGSVRWVNTDAAYHTVTASDSRRQRTPNGLFDAVLDREGDEFTRTFGEPGEYPYYCRPHAEFMAGVVRVVAQ